MALAEQSISDFRGDNLSVRMLGAKGDGVILKDGAITSGDATFLSVSALFVEEDVGKTIWVEGAASGGLDLLTTILSFNSATSVELSTPASTTVSAALTRYGTDDTAALQAAFDQCESSDDYDDTDRKGLILKLPHGRYLTTASITLRHNLVVFSSGFSYHVYGSKSPSLIMCCADVPVLQYTDTSGDGLQSFSIQGVAFNGTRRSGSKGIYTAKSTGLLMRDLAFNWFGDQAVHLEGGIFDNRLFNIHATGSCLVRARTDYVGVIDISQTDVMIENCLATASCSHDGVNPVPAVDGSFGDGFIAAFAIRGGNMWMSDCMAHHSQIGMYVGAGSDRAFVNVRADDNQGHGWVIDGGTNALDVCRSFADGQDADGTYSGFVFNGGDNDIIAIQVNNFGYTGVPASPLFNRLKHAVEYHTPNTSVGNRRWNLKCQPYCCTDVQVANYGTQTNHAAATLLNLADPNESYSLDGATYLIEANLALKSKALDFIEPTAGTGARGLADEKNWRWRLNYDITSPGYSQLIFVLPKDDYSNETPCIAISRTRFLPDFIKFYNMLVEIANGLDVTGKLRIANATTSYIEFLATTGIIQAGSGSPEGVVTAVGGSLYLDGAGKVWAKTTGTGNTGWSNVTALFTGNSLGDLLVGNSSGGFSNLTIGATNKVLRVVSGTAAWGDINADVIADGSVSNTEFQYLNGLTAGIQAQLNGLASLISTLQADVLNLANNKADAGVNTGAASAGTPHTHTQT